MNKGDLIAEVSKVVQTKKEAQEAVDCVITSITRALKKGEDVTLTGFGTFRVVNRKARKGRNPNTGEEISIKDILTASKNINTNIHICHLSTFEGLEVLKNRTANISCGVTPHHSLISAEDKFKSESLLKVNPPIRTRFDKEALFKNIQNGFIDVLESDHAPHTLDEKNVDFENAPSGLPGVETMFPLFLFFVKREILPIKRLISLLCERPAELMQIPKGKIEVGRDADFIVVDLKDETKIKPDRLHSKCGWSPYEGWPAIFPSHLFIRGKKLIEDNEIQVSQGFGEFVGA